MSGMYDPIMTHKFSYIPEMGSKLFFNELKNTIVWNKKELILDMGCGTGKVTREVLYKSAPTNTKIIGLDIAAKSIEFAKTHYPHPNITYMTADITDDLHLTMKKELFTKIVSLFTLYRIKNIRNVFENMYYLLKPEGEIMLLSPFTHDMLLIPPFLARLPKYSKYSQQLSEMKLYLATSGDVKSFTENLLKECGFEIITSFTKSYTHPYDSLDQFVECFSVITELKNVLPKDMHEEALRDAFDITKTNDLLKKDGDKYLANINCLLILARKQ